MHKPKGIIFDYGDTVLNLVSFDALAGNRRLLEIADNHHGVTIDEARAAAEAISRWIDPARDAAMLEIPCRSLNRLIYEPLGVTFSVSDAALEKEFWAASSSYKPAEGIYELLDTLESHGIKAGVLSNTIFSAATLRGELARHKLARRFSFIVTSADYGVRKPHRFIFEAAIKKMGLKPAEIWFVGDTPQHDIRGALDAGLYPVWLNRHGEPCTVSGDYLEINNLRELGEKLASSSNS